MGVVTPDNQKLEAKLLAMLMCVQTITGDAEGYRSSSSRFEKRKNAVSNVWTQALIELMMSVTKDDIDRLNNSYPTICNPSEKLTKNQSLLLDEFQYYLRN